METVAGRPASPLAHQIEEQTRDLEWTLAHFAFVANVTTLEAECDIAHTPGMSVASCHALPQTVLSFVGESAELLANYATFLADPGSEVLLLVNAEQRAVVRAAFEVADEVPQWQMVFRGVPESLDPGDAEELGVEDWAAMEALARAEKCPLVTFARHPFDHGPAFGIWERKKLAAMGMTNLRLPGAVQIGNLITRQDSRQRGYASNIIAALVRALIQEDVCVFALVDQDDTVSLNLAESLGFTRERPMYLMRCVLKGASPDAET